MKPAQGEAVLHVYGAVETRSPALPVLHGRQGARVRRVPHGPIALLVSEVPEKARLGRADLLAHAHVLEQVAERQPVLPMRFGIQARSADELRSQIGSPRAWADRLRQIAGYIQMSIQVRHHQDEALREVLRRDPELLALRQRIRQLDEWQGHADRVELGERIVQALEALGQEDAAAVLERLAPLAEEVLDKTEPGRVLRASFLIKRARRKRFDQVASSVQRELPRLELRYVGPQPPWDFLEVEEETWDS